MNYGLKKWHAQSLVSRRRPECREKVAALRWSATCSETAEKVCKQFCSAADGKATVERRYVLVRRRIADAEPCRHLFFAVAFEETGQRFPLASRKAKRVGVEDTC